LSIESLTENGSVSNDIAFFFAILKSQTIYKEPLDKDATLWDGVKLNPWGMTTSFYSPSPECPTACRWDEWRGESPPKL
jgi:hypothetical protein